jgi:molybdenum cofactor biosynthesis enzyme MoaA
MSEKSLNNNDQRWQAERGKKIRVSYPPRWATINIEGRCNLSCRYCGYHGENGLKLAKPFFLTFEEVKQQIDYLTSKVDHIHICGIGEPIFK